MSELIKSEEYKSWITDLKLKIKQSQIKAALAVNTQLILLYWELGKQIVEKQENAKWGSGFIDQLSKDLKSEFPDIGGFSRSNLFAMKKFYLFYNQKNTIVQQVVGQLEHVIIQQTVGLLAKDENTSLCLQIPWSHNLVLIEKLRDEKEVLFYIQQTITNNWSRAVLLHQIESNLYNRQGKAITNFELTLPKPQADLANEIMKDP